MNKFKFGDKVLISTANFDNLSGPKKMKESFAGIFLDKSLHGKNVVELILTDTARNWYLGIRDKIWE